VLKAVARQEADGMSDRENVYQHLRAGERNTLVADLRIHDE